MKKHLPVTTSKRFEATKNMILLANIIIAQLAFFSNVWENISFTALYMKQCKMKFVALTSKDPCNFITTNYANY